ncbi:MAG TPA: SDR family NAD(P)-dependent oxidoreductase [Anaerolineae bacterium]|nr:SDR family NAD(P)-dependent oxidoreductase [Anaerolineae bacterium]
MSEPIECRGGRFGGKVAIVMGAGRGMGRAVALLLAKEGARVAVNDINGPAAKAVAEEARQCGAEAIDVPGDVSDAQDVSRAVEETISRFGRIDILVNNAGISSTTRPLETIADDEWSKVIDVNLKGVFLFMRAVLPHMKEQRSGKIVNVSSSAGRSVSTFCGAHYTASKAGVLGLSRHAALEAAPFNINVNAVAPGTIDTPMLREDASEELIAEEARNIPLGRLGTEEDEANLVAFLASDEASFITGATIDINGGDLII